MIGSFAFMSSRTNEQLRLNSWKPIASDNPTRSAGTEPTDRIQPEKRPGDQTEQRFEESGREWDVQEMPPWM